MKQLVPLSLALALCVTLSGISSSAQAQPAPNGFHSSQDALQMLSIQGVKTTGSGLIFDTNRGLTHSEKEKIRVLRLPYPDRMVVDIPNAKLDTSQTEFPVYRNGIQKVMLSSANGYTYNSVRLTIMVDNAAVLSTIKPLFSGQQLSFLTTAHSPLATTAGIAHPTVKHQGIVTPKAPVKNSFANPLPPVTSIASKIESFARKILPLPNSQSAKEQTASVDTTHANSMDNILGRSISDDMSVLQHASFQNNALKLEGLPGRRLHIKNRFTLSNPTRLVVDIENTLLRDKEMKEPISVHSPSIHQIRLGQFDDSTVRVVIETDIPEQFEPVYLGNNTHTLALTPYKNSNLSTFTAQAKPGEVESIDLKKENGKTILRLEASTSIVHRLINKNGVLRLDLLNEESRPTTIGFDSQKFPEIRNMRLMPLVSESQGTKFMIRLSNPGVSVSSNVLENGKVIELALSGGSEVVSSSSSAELSNLTALSNGKAPFPARIVIDAGHGGKDNGASRSGVKEKDLNLSLALLLRDTLTQRGFKVYMTRSQDIFLPLPKITEITNSIRPDLFISIHHNASTNPALHGIETYYYTSQSHALANRVHSQSVKLVNARDGHVKQARFYVIHHTSVPAILCEVGYVSNPTELKHLQTSQRKHQTAEAIANGVIEYLKTRMSARAKK